MLFVDCWLLCCCLLLVLCSLSSVLADVRCLVLFLVSEWFVVCGLLYPVVSCCVYFFNCCYWLLVGCSALLWVVACR